MNCCKDCESKRETTPDGMKMRCMWPECPCHTATLSQSKKEEEIDKGESLTDTLHSKWERMIKHRILRESNNRAIAADRAALIRAVEKKMEFFKKAVHSTTNSSFYAHAALATLHDIMRLLHSPENK